MAIQDQSGRKAARARREAQINGKAAISSTVKASPARTRVIASSPVAPKPKIIAKPTSRPAVRVTDSSGRQASRARRQAIAAQGKAGDPSRNRQRTASDRQRSAVVEQHADCGCGCQGAGDCHKSKAQQAPVLRAAKPNDRSAQRRRETKVVTDSNAGRINSRMRRQALAVHGKSGIDMFSKGVSSAQMARQQNPEVSGRELARSIRTQRSSNGGSQAKVRTGTVGRRRPERNPQSVSGTEVSHSGKTTGDETGLCRSVTGTEYFSSEVFTDFCQKEAPKVPPKVQTSESLSGSTITTSSKVGRSGKVTGDERGDCRAVTGNEYVGREQYDDFCKSKPEPGSAKVSFSQTTRGQIVSGSKPARSEHVTGDEAGTCKAVTGTPYAGIEQYKEYCAPETNQYVAARTQRHSGNAGRDITGIQPGFAGLTGAARGACRDVSGTAYVGAEQYQEACDVIPAADVVPAQINLPEMTKTAADTPWGKFSVVAPSQKSVRQSAETPNKVSGTRYEQGRVSGTFSLGEGKVTGTEQFRFGDDRTTGTGSSASAASGSGSSNASGFGSVMSAAPKATVETEIVSRVTGEGLDIGLNITGNDWDRGDRVTGTEGASAKKRNPTA